MADFGKINEFRKTTQLRKINEDPTYLSFFLLFDTSRENSPLLSGVAEEYLRNVVKDTERADLLARFVKLLKKVNTELPWFWQSVSGLENTRKYNKMEDPWRGAESPSLEIECLENIELTAATLIDLYKRAAFDFNRWVEVIPKNLRHFQLDVWVTEVRGFQQTTVAGLLNSKNKDTSRTEIRNPDETNPDNATNAEMAVDAKPLFVTRLGHCEFDIESTSDMFASLSKSPEMAKSKIIIHWNTAEQQSQRYGANLNANQENSIAFQRDPDPRLEAYNPFDPINPIDKLKDRAKDQLDGAIAGVTNILGGLPGDRGALGNAHGSLLTGQLGQLANSVVEGALARLLLGNVHGINAASTIQDAINAASLNGIANAAGQLFNQFNQPSGGNGNDVITPKKIYPENAIDSSQGPINERIYEPGVDSSPDGNLNQNVHE